MVGEKRRRATFLDVGPQTERTRVTYTSRGSYTPSPLSESDDRQA